MRKTEVLEQLQTGISSSSALRWLRYHPELWVSLVLFVASLAFVSSFAKVVHWTSPVQTSTLESFCRWDCGWYKELAGSGYHKEPHLHYNRDAANWAFSIPCSTRSTSSLVRG